MITHMLNSQIKNKAWQWNESSSGYFHPIFNSTTKESCLFIYLFIWLLGVFLATHGLSLVVASGGYSWLRYMDFSQQWLSCFWAQTLGPKASVFAPHGLESSGSVAVTHGLSCSTAWGIFLDQGSNPCLLHWQVDSYPRNNPGRLRIILNLVLVIPIHILKHLLYLHLCLRCMYIVWQDLK